MNEITQKEKYEIFHKYIIAIVNYNGNDTTLLWFKNLFKKIINKEDDYLED